MEELRISLKAFAGPLDLLLHLINKNKIDIYDIPIAVITSQYMEYMTNVSSDMEHMSEFIVMASTLLEIKARMLLPKNNENDSDDTEDPRAELVEKLLEYKLYKHMSKELEKRFSDNVGVYYGKENMPKDLNIIQKKADPLELLDEVTLTVLSEAFENIVSRWSNKRDPIRHDFGKVQRDEYTIDDRTDYIEKLLENCDEIRFFDIFDEECSRLNIIVTFLALLELIKVNKLYVVQESLFEDILIKKKSGLSDE